MSESSHDESGDQDEGQVSEVTNLDPERADTPISDTEQIGGQPDDEAQEGEETGPDADQFRDYDVR